MRRLGTEITQAARQRYDLHRKTQHRLRADLGASGAALNQKLTAWWELDFAALRAEARKLWKRDIAVQERDDWEGFLAARRAEHQRLTAAIVAGEIALNARVYRLFGLTAEEERIVEQATLYRYGEI